MIRGDWLDCGCAEGFYSVALAERGAESVVGVDVIAERVERRRTCHPANVSFESPPRRTCPSSDGSFDGALVNEVLEHVTDEQGDVTRACAGAFVPAGYLALLSPNRWFPFEGHGARLPSGRELVSVPVPLMPWLPARLTRHFATARNYWPRELRAVIADAGFEIVASDWALAQFDRYAWMPRPMIESYRRNMSRIERSPFARFAAVSTLVLARRI